MTKLGIWKLMTHHHHHEHTLRRPLVGERTTASSAAARIVTAGGPFDDDSEKAETIIRTNNKPRPTKYERPKYDDDDNDDESSAHPVPASSEEFNTSFDDGTTTTTTTTTTTATRTTTTAATTTRKKKHVSFSTVEVRIYEVILGDNPDCSYPLSLGWRYNTTSQSPQDLDSYENEHVQLRKKSKEEIDDTLHVGQLLGLIAPTRISDPLMLTTMRPLTLHERRMVLRAQGHSEQQLRQAERKRKVELTLQWASGQYPKQEDFPYSQRFFLNYVL